MRSTRSSTAAARRRFASALGAADPAARRLLDALLASSGVLAALERYGQEVSFVADGFTAAASSVELARLEPRSSAGNPPGRMSATQTSAPSTFFPSNVDLAEDMQFYEVVKLFGQQVVNQTAVTWGNTIGLATANLGLAGLQAQGIVGATLRIISALLPIFAFALNKIYVGLLPANVAKFELVLASTQLERGEVTDAVLSLAAVNDPPGIGIQDFITLTLTGLGIPQSEAAVLDQYVAEAANNFLSIVQTFVGIYASQHPELTLDITVTSMPALRWETTITDPRLVERRSQTPNVISGLPDEVNWKASETEGGEGRIYAFTALGPDATLVSLPPGIVYGYGAFGDDILASNVVVVHVEAVEVSISPTPTQVARGETIQFTATVTGATDTSVTWTATGDSITSAGLFTAATSLGTVGSVTATSVEDPSKSDSVQMIVSQVNVDIVPASVTVAPGGTQQFVAVVNGAYSQAVTWTATCGSIAGSGLYSAPLVLGQCLVTASSVAEPTASEVATVTVAPVSPVTLTLRRSELHVRTVGVPVSGSVAVDDERKSTEEFGAFSETAQASVSGTGFSAQATTAQTSSIVSTPTGVEVSASGNMTLQVTASGGAVASAGVLGPGNQFVVTFTVPSGGVFAYTINALLTSANCPDSPTTSLRFSQISGTDLIDRDNSTGAQNVSQTGQLSAGQYSLGVNMGAGLSSEVPGAPPSCTGSYTLTFAVNRQS